MRSQTEKAEAFVALHGRPGAFVIPNPWDAGTAKLLAAMGFEALATTSLRFANTLGRADVSLDAILENCRTIAAATDLPVNADLENCGADEREAAARAIGLAAEAGAVGGSIEDSTGDPQSPIYDFALAVERVQAAVEAARALPFPFTLTARAENLLHGRNDLDDAIRRLQAFEAADANVLYSPGVRDLDTIRNVVAALGKPFNLAMGFVDPTLTVDQLSAAGVKRISVGGAMSRYALAAFLQSAREMKDKGSFSFITGMAPIKELREGVCGGWELPTPTRHCERAKRSRRLQHAWIASSQQPLAMTTARLSALWHS
jgi:2-methylisocitrate lyase-like PEP mutase family enzyme